MHCECSAILWVSAGWVLPTVPEPAYSPILVPLEWVSQADAGAFTLPFIPPDPPPR
jgi:hypothetical protein